MTHVQLIATITWHWCYAGYRLTREVYSQDFERSAVWKTKRQKKSKLSEQRNVFGFQIAGMVGRRNSPRKPDEFDERSC